ncbi:MAG: phosphoenolpyruvate carboxykinase (ATP), partial [Planctomycetia bacterium]
HPTDVIFLACDAFGVLPPVSRLTPAQAMYHFMSGYTAKVAGTEMGVNEPQATFSPCFGGPFLVWHPMKYAGLLAEKIERHRVNVWLVNTGWSGGAYGLGTRMKLPLTRAIVDAIHAGRLRDAPSAADPVFGVAAITRCPGVPPEVLMPRAAWRDTAAYEATARKLAGLFADNFRQHAGAVKPEVAAAGPRTDG